MKIGALRCSNCGANINADLNGRETIFCPYCGTQFHVDNGNRTYTKNININRVNHEIYTNDAEVAKQRVKDKESQRDFIIILALLAFCALMIIIPYSNMKKKAEEAKKEEQKNIAEGKIKIGREASDFEGEKYKSIVEELKAMGFTNIETVDLDDAGILVYKRNKISRITIDGESNFSASQYFYPDAQSVISYH